jgi:hypothetical protein
MVYAMFTSEQWANLRRKGILDPRKFTIRPLQFFSEGILCQIVAP